MNLHGCKILACVVRSVRALLSMCEWYCVNLVWICGIVRTLFARISGGDITVLHF